MLLGHTTLQLFYSYNSWNMYCYFPCSFVLLHYYFPKYLCSAHMLFPAVPWCRTFQVLFKTFSEWFWNCSSCRYRYWYHFHTPHSLVFYFLVLALLSSSFCSFILFLYLRSLYNWPLSQWVGFGPSNEYRGPSPYVKQPERKENHCIVPVLRYVVYSTLYI